MFVSVLGMIGCAANDDDVHTAQSALDGADGADGAGGADGAACTSPVDGVAVCPEDGGETFELDDAAAHQYALDVLLPARLAKAQSDAEKNVIQNLHDVIAKQLETMPAVDSVSPASWYRFGTSASIRSHQVSASASAQGSGECTVRAAVHGQDRWGALFDDGETTWGWASAGDSSRGDTSCSAFAAAFWCQHSRIVYRSSASCL
jgi:hypothetical protein